MKRLIVLLCVVSLQLPRVFAQEVAQKDIDEMSAQVFAKQQDLKSKQQELEQQITKQKEIVDQTPPGKQKDEDSNTLSALQITNNRAKMSITSLGDYLDQVSKGGVTVEDQAAAQDAINSADIAIKIINAQLKSEYLPSAPTQEQMGQKAQVQIEKIGLWDTFKLNIQSVFTQAKAALASLFGNKDAVMAAHKDLLEIYNQLKDYSGKAKSAGQLAGFYTEIGNFSDAIQMQATQLDAINNPSVSQTEKFSTLTDIVSDFLSLKGEIYKKGSELKPEDEMTMFNVETKISDFLGNTGFKINKVSAYEVLDAEPTETVDQIKRNYEAMLPHYVLRPQDPPEVQQRIKERLKELNNAIKELLGPDINNPDLALATKEAYDKSPIVQQGIEIKPMDTDEREAFDAQKKQEAAETSGKETGILEGDGTGIL